MSKLPENKRFLDVSDYGRPFAKALVQRLWHTSTTSIHLTFAFLVAGMAAILCILNHQFALAAFFLMVKNILDAADGEMARQKNQPSYTGRYLDSVFDFIINLGICYALYRISNISIIYAIFAFLGLEFQCAICNYYYVIQRNRVNGDMTSRIIEFKKPTAFPYESPAVVHHLHSLFVLLYSPFDMAVLLLDKSAIKLKELPNWFLTISSSLLLGFQFAIIAVLLLFNISEYILPFFAFYSIWGLVVIGIRKVFV